MRINRFDILVVILATETLLKSDIHDPEIIPTDFGYDLFRNDRSDGYGCVLIAVKRFLIYELTTIGKECEFIAVKITCKYNSLIMASHYRPTDTDSDYAIKLATAIESIVKYHPKDVVWIGGDINLPDINWSSNSISGNSYRKDINKTILEALANSSLEQAIYFLTRDINLLDIFATNTPSLVNSCKPIPGVSDHKIVHASSDISAKYQWPVKRKIWLWSKADLPSVNTDMQSFSQILTEKFSIKTDVNILWTEFSKKCLELMRNHVPTKEKSSCYSQPSINQDLKRLSRRKKKVYIRAKRTKKKEDWAAYKKSKKESQRECRRAYSIHVNILVSDDQIGNPKKLYSLIKSKKCDANGIAPLISNGVNYSESRKKADILNHQFTSFFTEEYLSSVPELNSTDHPSVQSIVVNRKGVLKLLQGTNQHKATGPDEILKTLSDEEVDIICLIFQASLDQGRIPKVWKQTYISPIVKKGDRHKPTNYRPVSLTLVCWKILEHIVHSLDRNKLLSDAQHGFRQKHSCESQLILTIQDLSNGLNNRNQVDAILLDFSKAFDQDLHQRLLEKLQHYGIRGHLNDWVADSKETDNRKLFWGSPLQSLPRHTWCPTGHSIGAITLPGLYQRCARGHQINSKTLC